MNRSAFLATPSIALIGAVLLTLALTGCATMTPPPSDDAPSGLVPSGRGAP